MNKEFHVHGAKMTKEKETPKPEAAKPPAPAKVEQPSEEVEGEVPTAREENEIIENNIARRRNALRELAKK